MTDFIVEWWKGLGEDLEDDIETAYDNNSWKFSLIFYKATKKPRVGSEPTA